MSAIVNADAAERDGIAAREPRELAHILLERDEPLPENLSREVARDLAWELKHACYAAWSTQPQRAIRAARALSLLAQHRATRGRQPEVEALAAWTAGIAFLIRGEMADAVRSFDLARDAFIEAGLARQAPQTQVPKIMALAMLGRHEDAVATAEGTQRELREQGDDRAAAKVSLNLGSLHLRREAFAKAAAQYRQAAVLFARVRDHEHSIMADIGIADALTAQGAFDEAFRIYTRVRMRAEAHAFPVLCAMQYESLALLELARGNYAPALAGLEASRRAYESLGMPQHLAIAEKQLADAYLELRLVPEAIAMFDRALSQFEAQEMRDDVAWTLTQRGRAQALAGRTDLAHRNLSDAARHFAEQANVVGEAAVALARAELALSARDGAGAWGHACDAAESFRRAGLRERELRAEVMKAEAMLQLGTVEEAQRLFATALERACELQVFAVQVRCLTGEGSVALACGDAERARKRFEHAVELFEQQRRALPGDDLRDAFLIDHLRPYRELVRIALDAHERSTTPQSAGNVLATLERFRARALSERLASDERDVDDASSGHLRGRANWLRRRVIRMAEEGEDVSGATAELRRAESELLEHARRQRLGQAPAAFNTDARSVDVTLLQGALENGDALVEYGVIDDELFACIVTPRDVIIRRNVASWCTVQDALRSARFQMESLRPGEAVVQRHLATLAARARARMRHLHDLVWAPLERNLADVQRLLIVPHAALGTLPFCALHDGTRYLAERADIAIAQSARLAIGAIERRPAVPRAALVLGVSRRLAHARGEAASVASMLPGAVLALDEGATVQAFADASSTADLVHLACHAQFRTDNPMFSALHLNDGTLTAEAIERLRLRSPTVVLSACETALAGETAGDEMFGLVRSFLVAGAARVVASLWPVDDAATATLMRSFYKALLEGVAPSAALRRAQCELMCDASHPAHWAAFAVFGAW